MQLQGIKAELNELQKNCKANSEGLSENSSFFEDLNRKIKSIENENQISIEKIKSELKDIEKIKNKSDEKLDSLFGEIEKSKNYNKDIQNWQFYVNEDIKSIKSEIEKYKSGIPSQTLAISNQPQITSNPDFYSQTRTLPQNHHINAQNERSEREAQLLNAHIQTQSLRPQRFSKSGLPNIGNTCYMNSVIQILASSADFAEYLYSIPGDDLLQSLNSVILSINANYGKNKTIPLIENFKQLISREYSMVNFI
ncbi:unnamed protein product [Blepharisma stoltei]|uniref:USP domain-containing protein n=1 Tax=Blepharisma stoltei TaxID=1481888 RepID=A0AAU9IWJ4_9CILI|nr:unnamed protein product [Blepharisma stoltei]